jgi:hypothetical protein
MRKINYIEDSNGARWIAKDINANSMEIFEEISRKEHREKYSDSPSWNINKSEGIFLDNGDILLYSEWNGEKYFPQGKDYGYKLVYENLGDDDINVIGYYKEF